MPENLRKERRKTIEDVKFSGGTAEQQRRVSAIVTQSGLSLENVKKIIITEPGLREKLLLGDPENTIGGFSHATKILILKGEALNESSDTELRNLIVHELAHANSPFDKNSKLYGSRAERLKARGIVMQIAKALEAANESLDEYHETLRQSSKLSKLLHPFKSIGKNRLHEETWAILVAMRYTNPEGLRRIEELMQEAHEKKIIKLRRPPKLLTDNESETPQGIDVALMSLLDAKGKKELEKTLSPFDQGTDSPIRYVQDFLEHLKSEIPILKIQKAA